MSKLILHIPHSSVWIPAPYWERYVLDNAALKYELLQMTDHFTDVLFDSPAPNGSYIPSRGYWWIPSALKTIPTSNIHKLFENG